MPAQGSTLAISAKYAPHYSFLLQGYSRAILVGCDHTAIPSDTRAALAVNNPLSRLLTGISPRRPLLFFYGNTIDLPADTHDADTLADNSSIRADPLFFFSSAKVQSTGLPAAELAKFVVDLPLGDDLRPFHLANILLHIGNALLLASLAMRLTRDAHLSSLTALLFALSPVHHQAIHHMSAMDYLLSGAFALGVIHALLSKRLGWGLGLAALSILSHGASFAPLVLLALSTQHRYRYAAGLLWHIPPLRSFDNWELWTGFAVALAAVLAAWRYEGQTRYIIILTAAAIAPYGFMYTDITEGYSGGAARYRYVSAMGACWLFSMGARSLFKRLRVPPV